jgi:hypothetical protein
MDFSSQNLDLYAAIDCKCGFQAAQHWKQQKSGFQDQHGFK